MNSESQLMTVDQLAERYITHDVNKAFSNVDLEVKEVDFTFELKGVEIKGIKLNLHLKGLIIALAIFGAIGLASLPSIINSITVLLSR